jgi:hypothetical protein
MRRASISRVAVTMMSSLVDGTSNAQGLCDTSPCGGGHDAAHSPPWSDARCKFEIPKYQPYESPINPQSNCNYFHNLAATSDNQAMCQPCGWPGRMCETECIYAIEYDPVGLPEHGTGTYAVRPEFRTGGHLVRTRFRIMLLLKCVAIQPAHSPICIKLLTCTFFVP